MTLVAPFTEITDVSGSSSADSRFVRRLLRRPQAVACLVYLAVLAVVAIASPILLPDVAAERAGDLADSLQGPSSQHWLGTDSLGRDVLQRLLVGSQDTLIGVGVALVVVMLLGIPLGLLAGYVGGRLDRTLCWIADLVLSLPAMVLVIVVLSVFSQNLVAAMVTMGVLTAPALFRVVRAATLPVREQLYIAAAVVAGLSPSYIVRRHVLPRIVGPIIVQLSLLAAGALLLQTGLAFLSLIAGPPAPSWGGMVADGVGVMFQQGWLIWPPGIAIALTVLALGLLGDAVRDVSTEGWSPKRSPSRSTKQREKKGAHAPAVSVDDDVLLGIRNLTVSFASSGGNVRAAERVSFEVGPGETVGVVGESGCGKTTTALAILGMLGHGGHVEDGEAHFAGQDLLTLSERDIQEVRGSEIAYISQEPMVSLDPAFRIGWQLEEAVRANTPLRGADAKRRVQELLEQVQLPDPKRAARMYPHELSGGMAQRVVIARALAGEPRLLIADEPTTALDVTMQVEILELLRSLQREHGMAILLVTHDLGVVADICDRVVVMYAGEVVETASVADLFAHPGHPYAQALLASNPHNQHAAGMLPTIPGSVPELGAMPPGCRFLPRCTQSTPACELGTIPLLQIGERHESRCVHAREVRST